MLGCVSNYVLNLIVEELVRVKSVGFDKNRCGGCTLTCTHGLPCAWTRLSFKDIATQQCSYELSIDKKFKVIAKRFKKLDIAGKINIKTKL